VVADDMGVVSAVAEQIDAMRKRMANAAAAVDITPETPVPGADAPPAEEPPPPPAEEPPPAEQPTEPTPQ
jgi:hypothetical protein